MRLMICITTMNRSSSLKECLAALSASTSPPLGVVVSDDSTEPTCAAADASIVAGHNQPSWRWIQGPHRGVCANRNNALRLACNVRDVTHVAFVDDDIRLAADFVDVAGSTYASIPADFRQRTILTGGNVPPSRLSFRGYFQRAKTPECVDIHAAVFPVALFRQEIWDENIFFGSEDAELCLRAKRRGFAITYVPKLLSADGGPNAGVFAEGDSNGLTQYQRYCEAARLYIGLKRYRYIEPDAFRLLVFVLVYALHLLVYLTRRRSLGALPAIIREAKLGSLTKAAISKKKSGFPPDNGPDDR